MSREAAERWRDLCDFLGWHYGEDTRIFYGTDAQSLAKGIEESSTEKLQVMLKQWRDWNDTYGCKDNEIVRALEDGLGVNRIFNSPVEAREFMNHIYDAMITAVRERTKP